MICCRNRLPFQFQIEGLVIDAIAVIAVMLLSAYQGLPVFRRPIIVFSE